MKIYNVNIYSVNPTGRMGIRDYEEEFVDCALVRVNLFGTAREIITNEKVFVKYDEGFSCAIHQDDNICNLYNKKGYLLLVKKDELVKENVITPEELDAYIDRFDTSKIKKYLDNHKRLEPEKLEKIHKKVKLLSNI